MTKFKNKELCKEVLQHLVNGMFFSAEWQHVYHDVIYGNMDLDTSIGIVFMHPRGLPNYVNWAHAEFSKIYHGFITHYNYQHRIRWCII